MRKVCKKCGLFVEKDKCPNDGTESFSDNWKGRLFVFDANKSEIAQKLDIKNKGEYAIKIK
jgi:DNA-directed RNA polymerase subunit E"